MEEIERGEVILRNPFMSFRDLKTITEALVREFKELPSKEVIAACEKAWKELDAARTDMQKKGAETLQYLKETGKRGIVLAGRPYHIDPEINHGIPELITSYDIAVLTEDSVFPSGKAGTSVNRFRPVDVPFPSLRSRKLCKDRR